MRPPEPRAGLPPDPVDHFAGREADLERLHREFQNRRRVSINGLGGVGKTQLAAQYLHRHRSDYPNGCFWLRGDEVNTLTGDLASLAWRLGLPERDLAEQDLQVEAVFRWLREHRDWLLVIDNVDEPPVVEAVRSWLPPGLSGRVLVTSRSPIWNATLEVEPLPEEVAASFLIERTGQRDGRVATALAARLGSLPLALEQAAAYLEETGDTIANYLGLLERRRGALFAQGRPSNYPEPVARTWDVSFRRLEETSTGAADLLRLCAFLASDEIPIELLATGAELAFPDDELGALLADELERNRAIGVLRRYSLIRRSGPLLSVHRLVQEVLRESLDPVKGSATWSGRAVRLVRAAFPDQAWEPAAWAECHALLPHALVVVALADAADADPVDTAYVMKLAAGYLRGRAAYGSARPLYERSLAIRERVLGPEHPDTVISLNNLALALHAQGELMAARHLHERALAIRERVRGPEHPSVAVSLNNLGLVVQAQGELMAARHLHERALAIREKVWGPEHPAVAVSLANLGEILQVQGQLATSRRLRERALAIVEKVFGPGHRRTANGLSNLGEVLLVQGELTAARGLHERALAIREELLGPEHPVTASSLSNLGHVLQAQGELAAARQLHERSLAIREKVLGPEHRRTATGLSNLGQVLLIQGELAAARRLHERALAIRETVLGPEHHRTAASLSDLGEVCQAQGELAAARRLHERALAIREKVLGPEHHYTAASLSNLGEVLQTQGDLATARRLHERALAIRKRVLGPEHPATVRNQRALQEP